MARLRKAAITMLVAGGLVPFFLGGLWIAMQLHPGGAPVYSVFLILGLVGGPLLAIAGVVLMTLGRRDQRDSTPH